MRTETHIKRKDGDSDPMLIGIWQSRSLSFRSSNQGRVTLARHRVSRDGFGVSQMAYVHERGL